MALTQTYFDETTGELMIDLPQEIIEEFGFEPGDLVQWSIDEEGRVMFVRHDGGDIDDLTSEIICKDDTDQ